MDALRTHLLLERLSAVLREDLRTAATGHGLALAQLEALHYFAIANRFSDTVSGLTAFLGTTKGTLSQTVGVLVRKGLLQRIRDERDRRVQHCRPTPEGQRVVDATLPSPSLQGAAGAEALEGLLRALLRARGGVAFDVCHTCAHFERRGDGGWCGLLGAALAPEETERWCREHLAA